MRNLYLISLLTVVGASAACTTNNNSNATATANAVIPAEGFVGRQVRVEISGDNTDWTSAATVSFGDGVTVGTVTVASPTDLFAEITISPTAVAGLRDVKVTDGGVDATLTQAFELQNPVTVSFGGTLAQGSIASVTITNHDFDSPFDPNNTTVEAGVGVGFSGLTTDAFSITGTMLVDVDAASGALKVTSGTGTAAVTSPGDMVTIAPRTAMPLTLGTAAMGTETKALDTTLYSLTNGATGALLTLSATTTNANANPVAVVLPASGHFADLVDAGGTVNTIGLASDKFYLIYFDNSGTTGYSFAVKATAKTFASTVVEAEPNDTKAQAQTTTTLPVLFTGDLTDSVDEDWLKVVVTAGKKIHVITTAPGGLADTVVDIIGTDGTTVLVTSDDSVLAEDVTSATLATAGTYFVKVYASPGGLFGYTPNHDPYQAFIELL